MSLNELHKKVEGWVQNKKLVCQQYKLEQEELKNTKQHLIFIQNAQSLAQQTAEYIQNQAHNKVARVVSKCLTAVFQKPYIFKINFEKKRGKTEANLVFEKNGVEVDPMSASGGGIVDVAAFALRLSCLILSKPKLRRILIMDEPFKFVSIKYRDNVREMLEELAEDFDVQIIMVTHIEELQTGNVIRLPNPE